ncbi:MAG: ATP-binding cassette domain-containing protein [Bacilli bacterium]|nr:ATP-binding cassette domain-containing protein [Bacilli bacterium]MDD4795558.1 ATP-binding cassette domain-containing protein [Bacilli bacterium]
MEILEFKHLNLKIKLESFINIIGSVSSGKTTLLKMLINKVPNTSVYIDNKPLSSYSTDFKKKNLTVCLNDLNFNTEYVNEELLFYQKILNVEVSKAYDNIKAFDNFFKLKDILEAKTQYLTVSEKALIKILSLLILNPRIIGIDLLLVYLPLEMKLKVIKYAKNNDISIINITSSSEELLLGSDVIVLDKYQVKEYDTTKKILENEKLLLEIGFELPFVVSLSSGLNYYSLLNKKYYSNKTLVGAIWK